MSQLSHTVGPGRRDSEGTAPGRRRFSTSTGGPFCEAKEIMGGFWVVEATDDEEAVALATEAQAACGNVIEVRPPQGA